MYGGLRTARFDAAPTTKAAAGPKATAVNTNGRNDTVISTFVLTRTAWRSATPATTASSRSFHHDGSCAPKPKRTAADAAAERFRRTAQINTLVGVLVMPNRLLTLPQKGYTMAGP